MYATTEANNLGKPQGEQPSYYNSEQGNRDYNSYRGRGRGGRSYYKGRGRGRFSYERDASRITCFRCDKVGHFVAQCPELKLKLQEAQETDNVDTQESDELMMHEIVFLNEKNVLPDKYETNSGEENVWYLDNGASNHMTGDKRYFSTIDKTISGKVRFGDDSRIDIKGKGTILFTDMNGNSRKMTDVYWIPDLKSNIISLGQATEAGCDIRMKGEVLTMHDQDGKLLVRATRSKNRLYKVRMGIESTPCLFLTAEGEASRWHARLGHANHETIRNMMRKELAIGMPKTHIESNICGSCMLGKQARQSFPKTTTYRATKVLELLHADLCGPITPSTHGQKRYIFVVIDDYTRYMWTMLLREKGEAFNKFKRLRSLIEKETKERRQTLRTDRWG